MARSDGRIAQNVLTFGSTYATSGAGVGTLVAAPGTGLSIWVNDIGIVNSAGTVTAYVGIGGTAVNGTSVLAKGSFGANGGIQKSFVAGVNAGATNSPVIMGLGGAGTVDFTVSYFISE